ncbi:chemotaxis protein CheW [bacterium BMS3Abin07]|nr:chemotaxis protein CheW [bacterium BMS3Abin07]HDL21092.1 purine-binding chemotaxis protein CheW [Nitrospirota bacterium]HDO23256.1 purine-binding chemotaxis protein CheW [Nitrospirota bacterium]HDZ87917.1 purine-binding chemotaxis protein CheW [Nitrospirota bacterium]
MDIAKIRKKRKQKLKKAKEKAGSDADKTDETLKTVSEEAGELSKGSVAEEIGVPEPVENTETEEINRADDKEDHEGGALAEFLVFTLIDEYYAFRLKELEEVVKGQMVTFVPKMPDYILGLTSLRGKMLPVMDLKARLSIKGERKGKKKNILIVKGTKGSIGMLIDKVVGVRRIGIDGIKEPPTHLNDEQVRFIESVVRGDTKFISILNLEEVLIFEPLSL